MSRMYILRLNNRFLHFVTLRVTPVEMTVGRLRRGRGGFTLIEVVASLIVLGILLAGVLTAYHRTIDTVASQMLRERAVSVAQRHMETLMANLQEPNTINVPLQDELDELFTWQLNLQRITLDSSMPEENLANTLIQATVTVECDAVDVRRPPKVELVRYFSTYGLAPLPGHAVAVPITHEYEEPEWYKVLRESLGREPTLKETLQHLIETGELPADAVEDLDWLEEDPCDITPDNK
ncbi:MAG: type II secretion system protein [Sedimentisphaerales bacterium]|nr:type II secretion system protein [Sedimentisphaerales bacterium]